MQGARVSGGKSWDEGLQCLMFARFPWTNLGAVPFIAGDKEIRSPLPNQMSADRRQQRAFIDSSNEECNSFTTWTNSTIADYGAGIDLLTTGLLIALVILLVAATLKRQAWVRCRRKLQNKKQPRHYMWRCYS